ncbi:hypothetical protein EFER_1679 [Escherichia fergusonii ATCC 35469]|uniref:Uncharacterized protein n=1 Tax=Escherichia fergusonii (strain ATCC 35469 / DSM 13698 / CCUG 18766 / IAM 14443 / JCM 21226 / LMG 7866 / NBRC 102419 / NCTC 12128 / CDC 0568-73) TaxID=585054 RepID=B7LS03_ESCF3|nr:hypothetical protein EFER_1679 [Escherichia fergusonii ATCC 35469]
MLQVVCVVAVGYSVHPWASSLTEPLQTTFEFTHATPDSFTEIKLLRTHSLATRII